MGFLKGSLRFLAYPILRPLEQAREEAGKVKKDLAELREARARRAKVSEEEIQEFVRRQADRGGKFNPTEEELRNPLLVKNPKARFEVLYQLNGWTEESLLEQLTSVRLTKRTAAVLTVGMLIAGTASLLFAPVWSLLILVPASLTGGAVTLAQSLRFALFQSQLEQRSLHSLPALLSRPDLFRYLFAA